MFEHPYTEIPQVSSKLCDEHRAVARRISNKSIVLLKNENNALPLSKTQKIAVVGKIASNREAMYGAWVMCPEKDAAVSVVDGLKNACANFVYEPCVSEKEPIDIAALERAVADIDTVVAVLEYHSAGEANSNCRPEFKGDQVLLLEKLKEMGKTVIAVMINGRPLALGNIVNNCDALVEAWTLGTEAGNAICDILFGDYNPSGRITATIPYYSGQWPLYYNHTNTGRPANESKWTCKYRDAPILPLYCFGYGLSYTDFEYSDLVLEKSGENLNATVTVKNIGKVIGEETVQLYIHRHNATRVRPVKELKGYKKVVIEPGESKNVTITVPRSIMGYFDMNAQYVTYESLFDIWVAHDSSCENGCHGEIVF